MRTMILIVWLMAALPMAALAKIYSVAVDLSGSNMLLAHENFAHSAAQYLTKEISTLKNGDTVRLQTFGARDNAANILEYEFTISRRLRAGKVAATVSEFIRSLPDRADISQASTNLISWLEFNDGFDCANGGQVLVFTDALEASQYVDPKALLNGSAGLPEADVDLTGCTLTLYGLGAGFPPQSVKHIRNAWQQWAEQAGANFKAVIR